MRPVLAAFLSLALGACVRLGAPAPIVLEQVPLAVRADGSLLAAEYAGGDSARVFVLGESSTVAQVPLPAALLERLSPTLERAEASALRPLLLQLPAVQEQLSAEGAQLAFALSPVPSTGRRRFEVDGLTLRIEPSREGIGGARLAIVWGGEDGPADTALAETAVVGDSWVGDAYRAGDRVVIALGSLAGGHPVRRVQTLVSVRLPAARARVRSHLGRQRYAAGDMEGAAAAWRRATEADPTYADAHYDLACALALLGDVRQAEEALARAHAADPVRVRDLARKDPDLALVRRLPQVRTLLALEPDGP